MGPSQRLGEITTPILMHSLLAIISRVLLFLLLSPILCGPKPNKKGGKSKNVGGEEKIDGHAWFSTESPEVSLRGFLAAMGGGGEFRGAWWGLIEFSQSLVSSILWVFTKNGKWGDPNLLWTVTASNALFEWGNLVGIQLNCTTHRLTRGGFQGLLTVLEGKKVKTLIGLAENERSYSAVSSSSSSLAS